MAGNYMDAPAPRLAWDKDGSVMVAVSGAGQVQTLPIATNIALNSEDQDNTYTPSLSLVPVSLAILFPIKTDLVATFLADSSHVSVQYTLWVSKDTTNGADGTWTQVVADASTLSTNIVPDYREFSKQTSLAMGSVTTELKGIKVRYPTSIPFLDFKAWFLYGYPTPSIPVDRLAFWDYSLDMAMNHLVFDWGNTPRSSSEDRAFRIKNLATTLDATNLLLGVEALYPGSPSITGMFTFSWDDVNYYASLVIPDLSPGEISPVIYIRRVIPSNAEVGVRSARVSVEVGAWV